MINMDSWWIRRPSAGINKPKTINRRPIVISGLSPLSKSICRKFASILWRTFCLPATFILSMTIPDCRTRKKLYLLTFFMSIVWVSAVTYVLSWMLTICGDVFGINDIVMGIGVLAVGSSIPEAVSSIINAQNGEGSMSISSALGSNTMDILLCLGLPWFVKTCVLPTSMRGGPVTMETDSLFGSCVCMIAAVAVLDAVAAAGGFVIHRPFGCACLVGQAIIVGALLINGQNAAPIEGQ